MRKVGSIAFYPGATNCAHATIGQNPGSHFQGSVEDQLIESRYPKEAFEKAGQFFKGQTLEALCITMYGIVDAEKRYFMGSTQEGWREPLDIAEFCQRYIGPDVISRENIVCSNDSAAAAVAEYVWKGEAKIYGNEFGRTDLVYFGILDGIGSGVIQDGYLWDGFAQPEMGHLPVRRFIDTIRRRSGRDPFPGTCPYHYDCVEGLASQYALTERMKLHGIASLRDLLAQENHELWDIQAYYLAELAVVAGMMLAPRRIIFGGPMIHSSLIRRIRNLFDQQVASYPSYLTKLKPEYISESEFRNINAPLFGGLELARLAVIDRQLGKNARIGSPKLKNYSAKDSLFAESIDKAKKTPAAVDLRMVRMGKPSTTTKKIFGLSITETVQWAFAKAINGRLDGEIIEGEFAEIPKSTVPFQGNPIHIQFEILEALKGLRGERPELFEGIDGIGVSSIGVVSPEDRKLVGIARKNWAPVSPGCLINFNDLFFSSGLFSGIEKAQIEVQNDAPARCLTEYYYDSKSRSVEGGRPGRSLMYLMVGEGVNGAIIHDGELPFMLGHPELGHQLPQPHILDLLDQSDRNPIPFDERRHTGCPKHLRCFEGVASRARFRAQWGAELSDLPPDHVAWEIEAYYLSQLAMNAALTHDPDRILFGGHMFTAARGEENESGLIKRVRSKFLKQNAGYLPKYTSASAVERLIVQASMGEEIKVKSALVMACVGASLSVPAWRNRTLKANQLANDNELASVSTSGERE